MSQVTAIIHVSTAFSELQEEIYYDWVIDSQLVMVMRIRQTCEKYLNA